MRLAAGCQFRGNEDSLPLVVANLVALGVDLLILVDHLNETIPLDQLRRLTEGRTELRIIRKSTPSYAQAGVHSMLMRIAQEAGAHAYLHVDADEMPDDSPGGPSFREVIATWLARDLTPALLIPCQNYVQRRDIDRWGFDTLDVPVSRVLGANSDEDRDAAGYLGRTPTVRAIVRLASPGMPGRWVRWGSHRLYGAKSHVTGEPLSMIATPHLVLRHLPFPSRLAFEARRSAKTSPKGTIRDNRGDIGSQWASVSIPASTDDTEPGPPVGVTHDPAFARIRLRIEEAGLAPILRDTTLANTQTSIEASAEDTMFASAADLLDTAIPRGVFGARRIAELEVEAEASAQFDADEPAETVGG